MKFGQTEGDETEICRVVSCCEAFNYSAFWEFDWNRFLYSIIKVWYCSVECGCYLAPEQCC